MNSYELAIVLDGKATAAKKKTVTAKLEKLIEPAKGKLGKPEEWPARTLAYKIGKSETGVFLFFPLELTGEAAKSLSNKLRLEEEILRYLLVKQEKNGKKSK